MTIQHSSPPSLPEGSPGTSRSALSSLAERVFSPTNRAAALFGVMGLGFSGGQLILAKALPTLDYAVVALVISILSLAVPLAPLGIQSIVNRRLLGPSRAVLRHSLLSSVVIAAAIAVASRLLYRLGLGLLALLVIATVGGGITVVAAAVYQRFHRFNLSLVLDQSATLTLLLAAVLAIAFGHRATWFPLLIMTVGYVVTAIWGWRALVRHHPPDPSQRASFTMREAIWLGGINAASVVFGQLERLLIPKLLTMGELASFSVLAALVIAPYRILQMGATFTALPRIRALPTVPERRRFVVKESVSLVLIVLAGSLLVVTLTPWIVRHLFTGKYEFSRVLILAGIWTGSLRAFSGLSKGISLALCTDDELARLNALLWICTGVAVVGGVVGARWGLPGLIFGSGAGWLAMTCGYAWIARPHLRAEPTA